ncbi:MAG: P1 family peptidase [Pseudomonadota bacterium]|nr:P1 family peptidase [Pseudomonadota bacterium]
MKTGPKNLITDVSGILVGNSEDKEKKTGTTVLVGEAGLIAGYHVMGGAPGTRETDLLAPDKLVEKIDAIVLSGGSAFGLDAASGVSQELLKAGRGFPTKRMRVPIIPSAILYDLDNGGDKNWPTNFYRNLGIQAIQNASLNFKIGSSGAGAGATTGNLKGGLGSASLILEEEFVVGAIVAVSSMGSTIVPGGKHFWAAPFELDSEFGGLGIAKKFDELSVHNGRALPFAVESTTIGVIATDAKLTKAQATRISTAAHDGLARSIFPSHTPFDGDLIFCVSTGKKPLVDPALDTMNIGNAAAHCVARAVARAVYSASYETNDKLPCWSDISGTTRAM